MKYQEVVIQPAPGGFGEFEVIGNGELWADEDDLYEEIFANVVEIYELGVDMLPADVPDIRGRIRNEPARVFAVRGATHKSEIGYCGIREVVSK